MGNPLMRSDIANAVSAGMDDVFWNTANKMPKQFEDVFGSVPCDSQYYYSLPFYGFGQVPKSGEATAVTYDSPGEGYKATAEPDVYKLACRVSREAYEDERYNMLKSIPKELSKSFVNTENIVAFTLINNGFNDSYTFADREPLFGDATTYAHPLKGSGGLGYNRPASAGTDLDATSLMAGLIALRRTLDDRGGYWNISLLSDGVTLMVPLELQDVAYALVKSQLDPESAMNAENWLRGINIKVYVCDFLTDPDAWFLIANKSNHRIKMFNRIPLESNSDRESTTGCLVFGGYQRYIPYPEDWRGIYGNPGL